MTILAIETSVPIGSIALVDPSGVREQIHLPTDKRTAQCLVPMVDRLLKSHAIKTEELTGLAASVGPGSFTGLRIGLAFAKTLAYARRLEIAAVDTPIALAHRMFREHPEIDSVEVVIDAQRSQLYSIMLDRASATTLQNPSITIVDLAEWVRRSESSRPITGPGLVAARRFVEQNLDACGARSEFTDRWVHSEQCFPQAADVGRVGCELFAREATVSCWKLEPVYGRRSAAEEKASRSPNSTANK